MLSPRRLASAGTRGGRVNQAPEVKHFDSPADEIFADFSHLRDCRADGATQMWPRESQRIFHSPLSARSVPIKQPNYV